MCRFMCLASLRMIAPVGAGFSRERKEYVRG